MSTFAALSGLGSVLLGLLILMIAFLMRRSTVRKRKALKNRDVSAEVRESFLAVEKAGKSQLEQLELRLHDLYRDVEALAQTRIALLQQLIETADERIQELRALQESDNEARRDAA